MMISKNLTLKQYNGNVFKHILTSQFVYTHPANCIELKNISLKIKTRKQKKIHFLYLWLLTNKVPYLQKFYSSWKTTSNNFLLKTKAKKHSLQVIFQQKHNFAMLHVLLMDLISKQMHSGKKVWTLSQHVVQTMMFSASLTRKTSMLQMKNTYFPNIPLTVQFQFSKATAFQKLFFLRSLKVLSPQPQIPALDFFI